MSLVSISAEFHFYLYVLCYMRQKNIFENKVVQPRKKGVMLHSYLHTIAIAPQRPLSPLPKVAVV